MRSRQLFLVTAATRVVVLIGVLAPVLWRRDSDAVVAVAALAAVWAVAQVGTGRPTVAALPLVAGEAMATGIVAAVGLQTEPAVLGALLVAPFVGGLYRGVVGVGVALLAEVLALSVITLALFGLPPSEELLFAAVWLLGGLGLGFIATFVRSAVLQIPTELAPYLYAQELIRELIDLSGGLRSGLDVTALGGSILAAVNDRVPTVAVALYAPRGEALSPLVAEAADRDAHLPACGDAAQAAWSRGDVVVDDRAFAWPLGKSAVVAGLLPSEVDLDAIGVERSLARLEHELRPAAVHLDTALLFAAFRDSATADERQRLAREMHDGVAQDIASLGYLIDALAAGQTTTDQQEQLRVLRERVTAVVAEVRQAVLTLRSSVGRSPSLGAALATVARHLSEASGVAIQVTADEHPTRLQPEVEAELFRIGQEAMNNAVKHAHARSVEVLCQVHAPDARIVVTDDGVGMQQPRPDSHGLAIMRERASLVGAELAIEEGEDGGVRVAVGVGRPADAWPSPRAGRPSVTADA